MTAEIIFHTVPLGSLIRYFDGTAKPPARFTKKLAAWSRRNGVGRLVKREPCRQRATYVAPATITLLEGNFAEGGVILVAVMRTHAVDSDLSFEIVARPATGMVRVLHDHGGNSGLLHLADSIEAAELWLAKTPYRSARLEEITADEVAADVVDGRAAT